MASSLAPSVGALDRMQRIVDRQPFDAATLRFETQPGEIIGGKLLFEGHNAVVGRQSIPMATVAIPSEVFFTMAISPRSAPISRAAATRSPS